LEPAHAERDLKNFTTHVHALKGASASIGAAAISLEAAALEDAARRGDMDAIRESAGSFRRNLSGLLPRVRSALAASPFWGGESDGAVKVSDNGEIIVSLVQLREALVSNWAI